MTSMLLQPPLTAHPRVGEDRESRPAGNRPTTLAERLEGALRTAYARGAAECPVCRGELLPAGRAARCGGCGSTVS